jgi:SAM-dependent methyltransferase
MAAVRQHPDYGNWVSSRLLLRILSLFALFAAADILLWALIPRLTAVKIVLASVGALTGLFALYLYAARRQFAADGGNVQAKIVDMLTERIEWDGVGKALDVGCGSGALTIGLAKKYETAHVTGVDDWGGAWAYSKKRCEENSRLEGTL